MKTIITTTLIATSLLLTGFNVIDGKRVPSKQELETPAIIPNKTIYIPAPSAPFCPSGEYQVTLVNRSAEGQTQGIHTQHCPKCSIGALFKQGDFDVCTYCENKF